MKKLCLCIVMSIMVSTLLCNSHYSNIVDLVAGTWIDNSVGVMVRFSFSFQDQTGRAPENPTFAIGSFSYLNIYHTGLVPFDGGKARMYHRDGYLYIRFTHDNSRFVEEARIDYYDDNTMQLYYIKRNFSIFLHRFNYQPYTEITQTVSLKSDPPNCAVYANGDYLGHTPIQVDLTWNNDDGKVELRFEKSGFITNRRLLTKHDTKICVVLQPSW